MHSHPHKGPVIISVEGGVKAISDWLEGGRGLNFFIKKLGGGGSAV